MMFVSEAAMLLWFDVVPEAIVEHDEWHTREHFPERIAIPGFRRASRWISATPDPRYLVCYEVDDLRVLSSTPYLERLNNPSEWTRRMMPSYRGMTRAFFEIRSVVGEVLGSTLVSVRFEPAAGGEAASIDWLTAVLMPELRTLRGVTGSALLASAHEPEMTAEQRIRGRDASAKCALLVSLYDPDVAQGLLAATLAPTRFAAAGVGGVLSSVHSLACTSTAER